MLQRSLELWKELQDYYTSKHPPTPTSTPSTSPLLNLCGGLMLGHPQSTVVQGTLKSIHTYNLPHEVLTAEQVGVWGMGMRDVCVYVCVCVKVNICKTILPAILHTFIIIPPGAHPLPHLPTPRR
ncbi:hypothetical protein EON65_41470 [archaeon]|nr:MAG: hypothetical protein EON65_41470 [archaeon]